MNIHIRLEALVLTNQIAYLEKSILKCVDSVIGKSDLKFEFAISSCFVFVALRPKSTAMVIAGLSVHLTTLFPGQA